MEIDFLGLSSKECSMTRVKEEINDYDVDQVSGITEGQSAPWLYSDKRTAVLPNLTKSTLSNPSMPPRKQSATEIKKRFSLSKKEVSGFMGINPFSNNHDIASLNKNLLGLVPILPSDSFAGFTEPCVNSLGSPAQFTIFYAGNVNVYDNILPKEAESIMLLAQNSSKSAASDAVPVIQLIGGLPPSNLSSPLSVSSHNRTQSGSGSTSTDQLIAAAAKTTTNPVSKLMEPSRIAIPQARKASLARFLEKRKERMTDVGPYNLGKQSSECATL